MKNLENLQTQPPGACPGDGRERIGDSAALEVWKPKCLGLPPRDVESHRVRSPGAFFYRRFLNEMINQGRARVDLSTTDQGG